MERGEKAAARGRSWRTLNYMRQYEAGPDCPPVDVCSGIDWLWKLERLQGAYSDRTLDEARKRFAIFERWCAAKGETALPASAATLCRFLEETFPLYSARSVELHLALIRYVHLACGLPDETKTEAVRIAFRRGLRTHGARARQTEPLNARLRDRLLGVCSSETLQGLRDRVLISLAYDTLCRRSELVALRAEDLERHPDGGGRVLIRRNKTDPYGRGTYAFLSARCVRDVEAWLTAAGLRSGPILRGVWRRRVGDRQLRDRIVPDRFRAAAERAGVEPAIVRRLTGHSARVGAAHDMAAAGLSLVQIMRAGRWRGLEAVALYVRDAPVNVWTSRLLAGELMNEAANG